MEKQTYVDKVGNRYIAISNSSIEKYIALGYKLEENKKETKKD